MMLFRNPLNAVLLLAIGLVTQAGAAEELDRTVHNLRAVDQHILPAYQALAASTASLQKQADAFCTGPDAAGLDDLRQAHKTGMSDWQGIQHIRFGPIEFLTRAHRYELWPDKRGTVGKHLASLLASRDEAALEPDSFAGGSVAVQGFSALERLLFDNTVSASQFAGDEEGRYRCKVVQAIAANLSDMSSRLASEWPEQREIIATAHGGNEYFDSDQEVAAKLLNNLHTQLQVIVEQKLERPLGSSLRKAKGKRAESWRSAQSQDNIRRNLLASRALYRTAFAPQLHDEALHQAIEQGFAETLQSIETIGMPLYRAVKDKDARTRVEALYAQAGRLKELLGAKLPAALGLALGFNSLDGD